MKESKVLILAGMHRSGTSLVAHYLSNCGLNIGDNLFNSHINSPDQSCAGHHEDLDFIDFHKKICNRYKIGGSALLVQESDLPIVVNEAEKELAVDLLKSRSGLQQWAWKDPRTTLFLEFWNELIQDAYYIFLIRHPLLVLDSLVRRGKEGPILKNPVLGLRSWKIYNKEILEFSKERPSSTLIVDIDKFITAPEDFSKKLVEQGFQLMPSNLEDIFSKKAFHDSSSEAVNLVIESFPEEITEAETIYKSLQDLSKEAF